MARMRTVRSLVTAGLVAAVPFPLAAQSGAAPRSPRADSTRDASRLDVDGQTAKARAIFQAQIDNAPDAAAKSAAQRAMAISYAFDGDCANAVKYEALVIAYWVTR